MTDVDPFDAMYAPTPEALRAWAAPARHHDLSDGRRAQMRAVADRIHELENALIDITEQYERLSDEIAAKGCDIGVLDLPLIRAMRVLGCATSVDLHHRVMLMLHEEA